MNDDIFCKIINGSIPNYTVYEDDIVLVFMDVNPDQNGHILIVPKKHITDFTELNNDTAIHINEIAKKMKELLYSKLNPDGIRLVNNYGIYQIVKHYHLHMIPCYKENNPIIEVEETYKKIMN